MGCIVTMRSVGWYFCDGYTKSYFEYLTNLLHFLPSNFVILHNKLFALELHVDNYVASEKKKVFDILYCSRCQRKVRHGLSGLGYRRSNCNN